MSTTPTPVKPPARPANLPPRPVAGWNRARTLATQSDEAKKAYAEKMFESSVQALRFSFLAGRVTTLHAICETLGLPKPVEADKVISKEELTRQVILAREYRSRPKPSVVEPQKQDEPRPTSVVPVTDQPVGVVDPAKPTETQVASVSTEPTIVPTAKPPEEITFDLPELEANPKVRPFGFQVRKTKELLNNFLHKKHRANVLLSQTGSGKTFMLGAMVKAMFRLGFFKDYVGMWPVLYVTKAPIVTQTEKVMENQFGLNGRQVHVTNIEQLRSQLGKIFIAEQTVVVQGQEHIIFKWRPRALPRLVIWDESQILMNIDSTQSKIAQALNDINEVTHGQEANKVIQVFSSATPFMRLAHTKCFAVAARIPMKDMI